MKPSDDDFSKRLKAAAKPIVAEPVVAVAVAAKATPAKVNAQLAKHPTLENVPAELAAYSDYQIVKELGRGGMGVVYLAKQVAMDRLEVLKVLNERLLDHAGAKQRFQNEIRAAAKLNHPHIVTSYSVTSLGSLLVFSMEYVHGMDLHKFIHKHKQLPIALACGLTRQIAAGLQHAHEKGLVHRDIKPSNIIVYKSDQQLLVKILDFGLAKATSEKSGGGLTQDGMMLGTPEYMSPEQTLDASKADIRADIYSLGCTLFHMLIGRTPIQGTQGQILMAHAQQEAPSITLLRPEVPAELAAVVAKMLAKQSSRRYQTPAEVAAALKPFLGKVSLSKGNGSASVAKDTVNDLASPDRDTSVEEPAPDLSLTPEPSIASEVSPQQQMATLMANHRAAPGSRRRQASKRTNWFGKNLHIALPLVGLVFAGLMWLGVLLFRTSNGTILIENLPADADVFIDGKRLEIVWNAGKDKAEVTIEPGSHQVAVKIKGITVFGESVEIEAGEKERLKFEIPQTKSASTVEKSDSQFPVEIAEAETSRIDQDKLRGIDKSRSGADLLIAPKPFISLWNGTDLEGWLTPLGGISHVKQVDGLRIRYAVRNWASITTSQQYDDFHVKFVLRIHSNSNGSDSNKQFFLRSHQSEAIMSGWQFALGGEMFEGGIAGLGDFHLKLPGKPNDSESLISAERNNVAQGIRWKSDPLQPMSRDDWHVVEFIAAGPRIVMLTDGKVVSDVTDEQNRLRAGHIVLRGNWYAEIDIRSAEICELQSEAESYLKTYIETGT